MIRRVIDFVNGNAFTRNSIVLFSGTMVANILNYAFHVVIGRIVDVPTYGEIESLLALTAIISVPSLAITLAATRFGGEMFSQNAVTQSRVFLHYIQYKIFTIGSVVFILAVICTPWVRSFLRLEHSMPLVFLWTTMFITFFVSATTGMLSGWQKFHAVGALNVISAALKLILGVVLIIAGFGAGGAMGALALSAVVTYGASMVFLRFLSTQKESSEVADINIVRENIQKFRTYIVPVFVGSLAITILGNIDMVFAKNALDGMASGQYGALSVVGKIIFFATGVIATVMFSMTSGAHNDTAATRRIFSVAFILTALCCGIALAVYVSAPQWVMSLLFGDKYTAVASYLGWFGVLAALYAFVNLILQYLLSVQYIRIAYYYLGIAFATIGLLFLFGKDFRGILEVMGGMQAIAIGIGGICIYRLHRLRVNNCNR